MENRITDVEPSSVAPAGSNALVVGSFVRFYDCDKANKDKDYSGNSIYWVVGKVINRRTTENLFCAGIKLGGDDVVDIELPDGRISKGHFTNGVSLVSN